MEPKQYKDLTEQSCLALRKINNINKINQNKEREDPN